MPVQASALSDDRELLEVDIELEGGKICPCSSSESKLRGTGMSSACESLEEGDLEPLGDLLSVPFVLSLLFEFAERVRRVPTLLRA